MIIVLLNGFERAQGATNHPQLNILISSHPHSHSQQNVYINYMVTTMYIIFLTRKRKCVIALFV